MPSVIYLTGAPASGKSTLSQALRARFSELEVFAYSEQLRAMISSRTGSALEEDDIRRQSASIITREDILALDARLIEIVRTERDRRPILIDSHAVTKETYGYRVTGFSVEQIRALNPDVIVCLFTSSEVMIERIARDAMGRPTVSDFEASFHREIQASVATQYGILLGKPVYFIDSSIPLQQLAQRVASIGGLI